MRLAALTAVLVCAALLAAGCGGGSSGGSNSTAAPAGSGANGGGAPKKATAPGAPAGSKVVDCKEDAIATQGLRATAVDCGTADRIMRRWGKHRSCALAEGTSRGSCALGAFRCQTVKAGDGATVTCARPGGDVSFVVVKPHGAR